MNNSAQWNAFDKIVIQKQRRRAALTPEEKSKKRFILRERNGQRPSAKSTVTHATATTYTPNKKLLSMMILGLRDAKLDSA